MRQIQLTRRAIKDLQRLQSTGALQVPEKLLEDLANTQEGERFRHTKHLSGFPHLWRSRVDAGGGSSLRLIWTDNLEDRSIKFLYVDQRDDDTYNIDLNGLPQEPAYSWNGETGAEWSLFLNGGYNASPLLTQDQQNTSNQVAPNRSYSPYGENQRIGFFPHITQSPPGTGKTITAALRARELYDEGWNVIFLLPQHLLADVRSFHCIQSISPDASQRFFYGTFRDWIIRCFPEIESQMLSPKDELIILQRLAERAEKSKKKLELKIELRDLILYQSFILGSDSHYSKNLVYKDNKKRIEDLNYIKVEWWQQELAKCGKKCRSGIADQLRKKWENEENSSITVPTQSKIGTVLIIDEAQDYLLNELKAVKAFCRKWHKAGHSTHLWLLGDLHQRIMPVDFTWDDLELGKVKDPGWKCFRNSSHILKFSNLLLKPVRERSSWNKTRSPHELADPDSAYEIGERVKLIIYPSQSDAERFLEKLSQSLGSQADKIEKARSLIYKLASRIKILQSETYESKYSDTLEFLNVREAKGREFDSCIAYNIFTFIGGEPTVEDWWRWYTLLTRTRSRLLVIVTHEQYKLLLKHIPGIESECERIDSLCSKSIEFVAQWVQTESNDLEFSSQKKELVERYLFDALQLEQPLIYWDMYEVLDRINIRGAERTKLEEGLLSNLRAYPQEILQSEFELSKRETKNELIHCLLLRAMGKYWNAAHSIKPLKEVDQSEYKRAVEAIATDLEVNCLEVEAARVRFQMLDIHYPPHFPMPEIAEVEGNLLVALVNILRSRFR